MRRMATANSQARAFGISAQDHAETHHRAQTKLTHMLARQVDPVPCPHCHKLQPDMVWTLRRRALSAVALLAVCLLLPEAFIAGAVCLNDQSRPVWWNSFLIVFAVSIALVLALVAIVCRLPFAKSGFERALSVPDTESDVNLLTLPRPSPDGWLAVRPMALAFPPLCAGCGRPPAGNVLVPLARLITLTIPLCPDCRRHCFRVRAFRTILPALIVMIFFGLILLPAHDITPSAKLAMTAFLTLILGLPFALLLRNRWTKRGGIPLQLRHFHAWSDDVSIRFRSPQMSERFLEECLRGNARAG